MTQLARLRAERTSMPRLLRPLTYRARALRRAQTPAERELWRWLRGRKLEGTKFRRQQPVGPFVVDFFSEEARLVIEADGAGHFPPPPADRRRDSWLAAAGLTVLRFENTDILHDIAMVLERIGMAIRASRRAPQFGSVLCLPSAEATRLELVNRMVLRPPSPSREKGRG